MSAEENLLHATLAINFVERAMTIGAQNKLSDVISSFGKSLICVAAGRSVDIAVPAKEGFPSWIREASAKARQLGCGNCGEQAAIAFCYLFDNGFRPIDYMARTNADHAFVVIGRTSDSNRTTSKIHTWNKEAVVCDPWHGKAYFAYEMPSKMYGGGLMKPSLKGRAS